MTLTPALRYQGTVQRILPLLLLACSLIAATPEDAVRDAETAWTKAVIKQDFAVLEKIYAPELIYAHSTGNIETREQYLARLKSGKQRYDTMTFEKTKINIYGSTAVSHSTARFTGKNDAGAFNDHLMLMHVWVKKGKNWQLVAHQTTRIP